MVPAKITSSIDLPRNCLTLCSPMTQRMASITLLLPQPLGPTTAVMPGGKSMTALSKKDLKPEISSFLSFINRGSSVRGSKSTPLVRNRPAAGIDPCLIW